VHFYSTFWSYACSNRGAGKCVSRVASCRAVPYRGPTPPRAPAPRPRAPRRAPRARAPKRPGCRACGTLCLWRRTAPRRTRQSVGVHRPSHPPRSLTRTLRQHGPAPRSTPLPAKPCVPRPPYKGPPLLNCTCDRRPPWLPPSSRVPASSRGQATVPTPPLAFTRATTTTGCPALTSVSPEPGIPRLAAAAVFVRLRQDPHRPGLWSNPVPSNPSTAPRPSPADPAAGLRRILAGPPPASAGGPHCKDSSVSEGQSAK
jgi:hypothetical protein